MPNSLAVRSRMKPIFFLMMILAAQPFFSQFVFARQGAEESIQITPSDGFILDGKIQLPGSLTDLTVKRVVILLHGSGPQSMDSDLTSVTKDGKQNLFFADLSEALSGAGFAVLRYNKRSYQLNRAAREDRSIIETDGYRRFLNNPLEYFVTDAEAAVHAAEVRFPDADIYMLGHSQGTFVALQVANRLPQIKGVALIGYYASSMETLLFEQIVYRPLPLFEELDANGDDVLDGPELAIDLDSNGKLEKVEFQAGNLSNLVARDLLMGVGKAEAAFPRTADILAAATFKVAFFQGMWDNQTPAYNAKAVELVNRNIWKKDHFSFTYFPNLGHALDARTSYGDLTFDTIDPAALEALVTKLAQVF
jgi:pimeloyl-ACP methyl ester carboxylesterase